MKNIMDDNDFEEQTEENDTQILPEDENDDEVVSEEHNPEVSPKKRRHRRNSRKHGSDRRHELNNGGHGHRKHRRKSRSSHGTNNRTSLEDVSDNHVTSGSVRDWPSDQGDVEDGEILEDGEIPEEAGGKDSENENESQAVEKSEAKTIKVLETESPVQSEGSEKELDGSGDLVEEAEAEIEKEEEETEADVRHERRERKRKRKEKKEKKKSKDDKKKKKRHEYVDYDRMDEMEQNWPGAAGSGSSKRSPPGPYDSPYRSPPGPYDSPYKSPPGPYDSPYASPPGPYDSPQYDEEETATRQPQKSLMSMVDDDFVDANIQANEKEGIFRDKVIRGRGRNRGNMKRKPDRQHSFQPMKKKPLLETPMDQRPLCKFFREGKCAKGDDCPFNHNFRPPKKPDVCKFYLNGSCSKGDACVFMHSEFPCKYFHMGANCYQGDNCRFNHDPLTDETRPLFDKMMSEGRGDMEEEECSPNRPPKPSLLGSPPRHIKEQAERLKQQQGMKNIPSIFDIQVFPPSASPQKHPPNSSPPAQQMNRPLGFYMDTEVPPGGQGVNDKPDASRSQNGPYGSRDGSFGPQEGSFGPNNGPYGQQEGNFGPQEGSFGPNNGPYGQQEGNFGPQEGSFGPNNGPYGQQEGNFGPQEGSFGPNNGPYGQQEGNFGQQEGSFGPNNGPYCQQEGNFGPQEGSFGPNNGSFGQQEGNFDPQKGSFRPQGGSFGPQDGNFGPQEGSFGPPNGPFRGPRGGAPNIHQHQGGPPQGPPGCQHGPRGPQFGPGGPGMMRGSRPPVSMPSTMNTAVAMIGALLRHAAPNMLRPQMSGPPVGGSPVQGAVGPFPDRSPQHYVEGQNYQMSMPERDQGNDKQDMASATEEEPEEPVEEVASSTDGAEETKPDFDMQSDDEVLKHLPPKQRELFLRIQQQQQEERLAKQSEQGEENDEQNERKRKKHDPADDNWYSSDEEEDSSKSLSDMLKNISKKSAASTSNAPNSSTLNVMQMINAIRNQAVPENTSSVDPRMKNTDPRQKNRDPRQQASPVGVVPDPWQQTKPVPPPPTIINSKEGDIPVYIVYPIMLDIKATVPMDIDISDAKFKNDPRIIKYREKQKEQSDPRLEGKENVERPKDPRMKQSDPRVPKQKESGSAPEKPLDPRLSRVASEQSPVNKPNDPRLQRVQSGPPMGMHNFPVRPVEQWSIRQPETFNQGPGPPANTFLTQGPLRGPYPGAGPMRVGQPENFNLNDGLRPLRQPGPRFAGPPGPGGQMMGPGCGPRQRFGARFPVHGPRNEFNFEPQADGLNRPPFRPGGPQLGRQDSAPDPRLNRQDSWVTRQDSGGDPRLNRQDLGMDCGFKRQDSASDPRLSKQDSYRDPRLIRQDSGLDSRKPEISIDPRLNRQDSGNDPRMNRQDSRNDPRIKKLDVADPRGIRKNSLEQKDSDVSKRDSQSPCDSSNTQNLISQEKEFSVSSVITRQLSNPGTNNEKSNVQSEHTNSEQVKAKFDHRNDPRFRRKPATESTEVKRKFIGQRKSSMEYSSPLGINSDKLDSGSRYNSYNRPQSNSNKSQNPLDSILRTNKVENSETLPVVSVDSVAPVSEELHQPNLPEPQLKDLFKTFDPTASPFC